MATFDQLGSSTQNSDCRHIIDINLSNLGKNTLDTLTLARMPISPPICVIGDPAWITRLCIAVSLPTGRMFWPGLDALNIFTVTSLPSFSRTSSVSSTMTTAVAPGGIGAPVEIRQIFPGVKETKIF
jgi:hypothetical protein